MIENIKIFLDHYKIYNENKLIESKNKDDQAIYYGYIKCIEATQNTIKYWEEYE